ncbi:MAG: MerR family transcriptional regulator [Dehalococcoidia bacterium]
MKVSELSHATGVPVASIKFYLREGLLPPGRRTGPNQADYSEDHIRRLGAIRALRDVAGLSILTIKRLVDAIDDPHLPTIELLGAVSDALTETEGAPPPGMSAAQDDIDALFGHLGWEVHRGSAHYRLASTLIALRGAFPFPIPWQALIPYAKAVEGVAETEIAFTLGESGTASDRDRAVEAVVVGTVVFEQALGALRRAAHEHFSRRALGIAPGASQARPGLS